MPKIEAARSFSVGISSVKRYVAVAREGRSLAPKKRPGSKPKLDESTGKLLEADLEERPSATLPQRCEFLRRATGVEVSDSTVSRMLKRLGWTRKKIGGCGGTRRVAKSRLASDGSRAGRRGTAGIRGRDGLEHLAFPPVRLGKVREASVWERAAQLGGERYPAGEHDARGDGTIVYRRGGRDHKEAVFEAYDVEEALAPSLGPGQVVVMDNLSSHKG